jgi:hypothetical protein
LEKGANAVTNAHVTADSLVKTVVHCRLPAAYRNILCILGAEGVRRRKQKEQLEEIMACCTNPAYTQLYNRWLSRLQEGDAVCK